jgi:hypothetical protein
MSKVRGKLLQACFCLNSMFCNPSTITHNYNFTYIPFLQDQRNVDGRSCWKPFLLFEDEGVSMWRMQRICKLLSFSFRTPKWMVLSPRTKMSTLKSSQHCCQRVKTPRALNFKLQFIHLQYNLLNTWPQTNSSFYVIFHLPAGYYIQSFLFHHLYPYPF